MQKQTKGEKTVEDLFFKVVVMIMMMMIGVLRPLLCTWQPKWAERRPRVMKRSQR